MFDEYELILNQEDVWLYENIHTTEWMKSSRLHHSEPKKYAFIEGQDVYLIEIRILFDKYSSISM
jgi:hypothetical protein